MTPETAARCRRSIGIDYGTKRIGVAVSDPLGIIAKGVATIPNSPRFFDELRAIVLEYDPETIVIGMPLNLKGEAGMSASAAEEFAGRIEREFGLPVVRSDERFTSKRAQETLREMGVRKKARQSKAVIDSMAAALILQGYLDARRSRSV